MDQVLDESCLCVDAPPSDEVAAEIEASIESNTWDGDQQFATAALISQTDSDWSGSSSVVDCIGGWSADTWELTLTQGRMVTFTIEDCCLTGDHFELWVNGELAGSTPPVPLFGPILSSGSFDVPLDAGTHDIRIRNAAFATFSPEVLEDMCPAGFSFAWTLGDHLISCPTGLIECNGVCAQYSIRSVVTTELLTDNAPLRIRATNADGAPISGAFLYGGGLPSTGAQPDGNGEVMLSYGFPPPPAGSASVAHTFLRGSCGSQDQTVLEFGYDVAVLSQDSITLDDWGVVLMYNLQRLGGIDPRTGFFTPTGLFQPLHLGPIGTLLSLVGVIAKSGGSPDDYAPRVGDTAYDSVRRYTSPMIDGVDYELVTRVIRDGSVIYEKFCWSKDPSQVGIIVA